MVRPLRIQYPGAVYHVTSRGDRREPIALDEIDRAAFLSIAGQALERFDAHAWAYCLMGNHYHLVIRTREANLSRLMRHLNGIYTQAFNRRHQLAGHLFQGRFKAILVDSDPYLLEVCRYVDLNPVRAGMVERPEAYRWSSYRALAGLADPPDWLDVRSVHEQIAPGKGTAEAGAKYAQFVSEGKEVQLWDQHLRQQIYLGDDGFIARMQSHAGLDAQSANSPGTRRKANVSKIQSGVPPRNSDIKRYSDIKYTSKAERNQNIAAAFYQGGHTQTAIALAFDISSSTVSRVITEFENGVWKINGQNGKWET
jgi:putative transposase